LRLDLSTVVPSVAGPKRPQDRIALPDVARQLDYLMRQSTDEGGFNLSATQVAERHIVDSAQGAFSLGHGDVVLAAITSCTNTSNPNVMLAAGLLAKKAVEKGLRIAPHIKTSLAPGSRVVAEYLMATGLQTYLDQLGFQVVAYGCTTCIGNSGELAPEITECIVHNQLITAAVLSGNRNFEARIQPNIKANFLASPPLVLAYALAGRMNIDLTTEPLGMDSEGMPVMLKDIWPSNDEVKALLPIAFNTATFQNKYRSFAQESPLWNAIQTPVGEVYTWPESTYIAQPPFFNDFALQPRPISGIENAKALLIVGDSVTTDHISPAGSFKADTPAGEWLTTHGIGAGAFNSYGSRRGHFEVMVRGTFANVRLRNLMLPAAEDGARIEGGFTLYEGVRTSIFDAAAQYRSRDIPTIVFAGTEYGTGSSRDWAAKGSQLLGIRAVIARSFERIHRANLVGMGILPLQFVDDDSVTALNIGASDTFDILGVSDAIVPQQMFTLRIRRADGSSTQTEVRCRIDTPIEVDYYRHGGILPFVLRQILTQ
jgi:aconitate hydratase